MLLTSDYLSLITSEHNQQPKFTAMVALDVQAYVDNQNLLLNMIENFNVLTAVGIALDYIGAWVGLPRSGLSDNVYRILLQAQIALNHWKGNVPAIYQIWAVAFSGNMAGFVQDNQDMSMFAVLTTFFPALDPSDLSAVTTLLLEGQFNLRSAGVEWLGYFIPTGTPVFACDVETAQLAGPDHGYFVGPLTP